MSHDSRFMSATTLLGDAVKNPQGESLGDLKEIMFDTATGKISYGVLSFGGVLGLGDKFFALPCDALAIDYVNKHLVLNASNERLQDAPGFDKEK